ncbi:MAG: DUF2953 domain-containing protein [Pseudomonadales bacterium]|nr:DUF2953 domain-containing protein [Pseudomonadales bacterium]
MGGLLWALAGLLLLLVVLLAIPVELKFDLRHWEGERKSSATLVWLFGAVSFPLVSRARTKPEQPRKVAKAKEAHRRTASGRVLSMLQTEGFPGRLLQLARDLPRRIRIRDLSLDARLGLDDPADTGQLWGVVGPLAALLATSRAMQGSIQPDFAAEVFEYQGQGHVSFIPIQVLALLLFFALSPVTLRALRAGARSAW